MGVGERCLVGTAELRFKHVTLATVERCEQLRSAWITPGVCSLNLFAELGCLV